MLSNYKVDLGEQGVSSVPALGLKLCCVHCGTVFFLQMIHVVQDGLNPQEEEEEEEKKKN